MINSLIITLNILSMISSVASLVKLFCPKLLVDLFNTQLRAEIKGLSLNKF